MLFAHAVCALSCSLSRAQVAEIRGDLVQASWGQQIRNYVFHPYKLVKDTRTGMEDGAGKLRQVVGSVVRLGSVDTVRLPVFHPHKLVKDTRMEDGLWSVGAGG